MTQAAIALAATLAMILAGIWFVSGRISRPIAMLRANVQKIAGGDLEARVEEITSTDEIGDLAESFNRMTAELKSQVRRLGRAEAASRDAVIFAMAKLAESRDTDTGKHLERICRYVEILGRHMAENTPEIDDDWVDIVTITAALHDIGKVGIPDAVLCKPGRLTDDERTIIQKHPLIGGDTLLALKRRVEQDSFLVTATEIAFAHHEKWDGSGYPFGLAGENIALAARIVAVADVYDALTCQRVYKKAMSHEQARTIIVEGSGSHFDPAVVEAFVATEDMIQAAAAELGAEAGTQARQATSAPPAWASRGACPVEVQEARIPHPAPDRDSQRPQVPVAPPAEAAAAGPPPPAPFWWRALPPPGPYRPSQPDAR